MHPVSSELYVVMAVIERCVVLCCEGVKIKFESMYVCIYIRLAAFGGGDSHIGGDSVGRPPIHILCVVKVITSL